MPTSYTYANERLDSQTGLLYDPLTGQYVRSDNVQDNANGMDPYAYVGDNPETRNDPSGHCWPLCTMILGAIIGAAVSVTTTVVADAVQGKTPSLGEVAQAAVVGAVSGAVSGLVGPEAGPLVKVAVGALASGAGQIAGNAMSGKPLLAGVGTAIAVGALTGGLMEGAGALFKGAASDVGEAADSTLSDAIDSCGLSFRADTPVATPKGEQTIGTLKVGQQVQAYNPTTKTTSTQTVQQVFINHDTDLIDVTLAMHSSAKQTKPQQVAVVSHGSHAPPVTLETVHTTQKHPWLTTHGWITAGKLRVGDRVLQLDRTTATVVALKVIHGAADMYDLTVSNVHTFAVGIGQFVVHNCSDLSESGIKDYLSTVGGRTTNESDLNLAQNENRIYLGHYGGEGIVVNGTDYPSSSLPGLSTLQQFAKSYGGRTLDFLPYDFAAMQPHIETADEILFNVGRNGIDSGSLTAQEFQFVIDREDILRKTLFLFGATY